MPATFETTAVPRSRRPGVWLPVVAVLATLFCVAQLGPVHPLSLLILATVGGVTAVQVARVAPVAFFWLVPLSMAWYWDLWIEPYDLLIVALAVMMALDHLPTLRWREFRLPALEGRYLLFLACLATTFFNPYSPMRLIATAKVYTMGLLAHEVARHAVLRYGRRALLIGPLLLLGVTALSLLQLSGAKGIPSFQALGHRSTLTDLAWGNSNYVAAVVVLFLPALLFLIQEARKPLETMVGRAMVAISVWTLFLTTSRGGFLLGAGYLASRAARARQALVAVATLAALMVAIGFTPFGQRILGRFSDPQGMFSVVARFAVWGGAWNRFAQNVPFGVGHGQGVIQNDRLGPIDPHEFLLTLLSEGGVLALAAWLWLLAGLWSEGGRLGRDPTTRAAGGALRATVMLGLLNSLFEPTFPGSLYFVLFWWMTGIFRGAANPSLRRAASPVDDAAQDRLARGDSLQHEGA